MEVNGVMDRVRRIELPNEALPGVDEEDRQYALELLAKFITVEELAASPPPADVRTMGAMLLIGAATVYMSTPAN